MFNCSFTVFWNDIVVSSFYYDALKVGLSNVAIQQVYSRGPAMGEAR